MRLAVFEPLRHRNFALVWSAALVSNVGTWMQSVALGVFVTATTHNPLWTGLIGAATFLPGGLLAPVGGALADRFDRRRWLLLTTLGETLFATLLAICALTGYLSPALAVVLAFGGGCISAVGFPAYQALLPDLVDGEGLFAAVTLSSAQYNMGRILGPVATAVALTLGSYGTAFLVNAVSFLAVVGALLAVRLPRRQPKEVEHQLLAEIRRGIAVAWNEPGCRAAITLIGLAALIAAPFIGLIPAVAIDSLGLVGRSHQAAGTSTLVVAQGVGAVLGLVLVPSLAARIGRVRVLRGAMLGLGPLLVLYGLMPNLWSASLALVLLGGCYLSVLTGLNAVVQLRVPAAARARVLSLFTFSLATSYTLGLVGQGAIARRLGHSGVRVVTVGSGLLFVALATALMVKRAAWFSALEDPSPDPATA